MYLDGLRQVYILCKYLIKLQSCMYRTNSQYDLHDERIMRSLFYDANEDSIFV